MNRTSLLLLLLLSCIAGDLPAASPANGVRETVGPMTVTLPADWRRELRPDGTIAFLTSADGRARSEVQFSSANIPGVAPGAAHKAIWGEIVRQATAPGEPAYGRLGGFEWSEMAAVDPAENQRFWYRLYTTKVGNDCVVVLVAVNSAPAFRKLVVQVDQALSKAQLGGQSTFTAAVAAATSLTDVPIVEAHIHTEIRAISFTSNVLTDHILLFKNGIAVRSGFSNGPRECYATLPVANLASLPSNYGRWREDKARAVDIAWQEGPAWHLDRSGDRLSLAGKVLLKYRSIDSAKIEGTYAYSPVGDPPTVLRFARDGGFEARNLTDSMVCQSGTPLVTTGSGRYEVRNWTLILRFDNGATNLLPLKIADQEQNLQNIGGFTVRSYEFLRAR